MGSDARAVSHRADPHRVMLTRAEVRVERVDEGEPWKAAMLERVDLGVNGEALYQGLFYFCTADTPP